jgi:hypothetical protein
VSRSTYNERALDVTGHCASLSDCIPEHDSSKNVHIADALEDAIADVSPNEYMLPLFYNVVAKKGHRWVRLAGSNADSQYPESQPFTMLSLAMCAQVRKGAVWFLVLPCRRARAEQCIPTVELYQTSTSWGLVFHGHGPATLPWIGTCHEGINTPRFDGAPFHATMLQQLPAVMCATQR